MYSVLLCSSPIHGHVAPMLSVARELAERGHRVRLLTGSRFRDAVERAGAQFLPLPADADYDDRDIDEAFPERAALRGLDRIRFDVRSVFLRPVASQLAAVRAALDAEPTDVVIAECMFAAMPALALAPHESKPLLMGLGIIPLAIPSVDTAPFGLGIRPMTGWLGRARNRLLRSVASTALFGPLEREARDLFESITGRPLPVSIMNGAALVDTFVQCTVPEFEYPRSDLPGHVRFIGPVTRVQPTTAPLPEWWSDVVEARSVVHVTQGTIANRDFSSLVHPTIDGLAADRGTLVVVSAGGRPADSVGPVPDNVRVASFLPYDRLLPHVDVMVTNGGYGGVHDALAHGIPLVVAGDTEDKPEVAARVAWSGVGIDLGTGRPGSAAVATAVRSILTDPRYRDASARMADAIAGAEGIDGLAALIEAGLWTRAVVNA